MKKNSLLEQTIASVSKGVFARLEEFLSFAQSEAAKETLLTFHLKIWPRAWAFQPFQEFTRKLSVDVTFSL